MGCIEFLIVLAMASLYFSIVPWCVGLDQLVTNIKLLQGFFKERWLGIFSANQPICEFAAIICLHTFDGVGKTLHTMLNKQCGRIGAVFWESLQIAKPGVFINEGVLVPLCRLFLSLCNAVLLCKLSLYRAVCVILFIANRVRLPFGFVLAT